MEPGAVGIGTLLPNVLGVLVTTGEALSAVDAEPAWGECPDP